ERFVISGMQQMPGSDRTPYLEERRVRFVLRFAPHLSMDDYERLAVVNAASEKERDRLRSALRMAGKGENIIAVTPEEKERLRAYREAVARLPRYDLPDLYTPDHSVCLFRPGDGRSWIYEKDPAWYGVEQFEKTLLKHFGMYNVTAARGGRGYGRAET